MLHVQHIFYFKLSITIYAFILLSAENIIVNFNALHTLFWYLPAKSDRTTRSKSALKVTNCSNKTNSPKSRIQSRLLIGINTHIADLCLIDASVHWPVTKKLHRRWKNALFRRTHIHTNTCVEKIGKKENSGTSQSACDSFNPPAHFSSIPFVWFSLPRQCSRRPPKSITASGRHRNPPFFDDPADGDDGLRMGRIGLKYHPAFLFAFLPQYARSLHRSLLTRTHAHSRRIRGTTHACERTQTRWAFSSAAVMDSQNLVRCCYNNLHN